MFRRVREWWRDKSESQKIRFHAKVCVTLCAVSLVLAALKQVAE